MILSLKFKINIKYVSFFFICSYIIFNKFIYINIDESKFIQIDNEYNTSLYEYDLSFSEYHTRFKAIAFYSPENNYISYTKYFNEPSENKNLNKEDLYELIKAQINLANKHGISGFAIYYNLFQSDYISKITVNIFLYKINFPFFLICRNIEKVCIDDKNIEDMILNLKNIMISENYIKIKNKPVLSIEKPYNVRIYILLSIKNLIKQEIGDIFLLYPFNGNFSEKKILNHFDAIYDFSLIDIFGNVKYKHNIFHYSGIIYKNLILNQIQNNISLYRTCSLNNKFKDYTPEKFYISNNIIFENELKKYNKNEGIIFIDSWNDYQNGKYLEFDKFFGYSSINYFSRAIFNISNYNNNLHYNYNEKNKIAIHVHIFYEEISMKILNKLKLITIAYDLFVSTISSEKKYFIEKHLKKFNLNYIEIKIFDNIGRDVYPFIEQMKSIYKRYKYICHLHSKKSNHNLFLGSGWSEYLFSNLIGNKEIVLDILNDFEINQKLGFIFPETYHEIIKDYEYFENINFDIHFKNIFYMNDIIRKSFHKYIIKERLIFPVGNMFWAKTKAIYQIFKVRLYYPKELNQTNETIMHGIERIWLYLVKLNGYYYKRIFKHY